MPRNKTAVMGVVFPGVESFINDYLSSLEMQTFTNYDLVIINDGFENFDGYASSRKLNIKEIKYEGTPAKIREYGLNHIKNAGYENIVFTDTDDYFSENRIGYSCELLKEFDVVVNDVSTVSQANKVLEPLYMSNRVSNLSQIEYDFIIDKNIFGLSNTAIKSKCLNEDVFFEADLIAVDWFLFSYLLGKGCNAIFTNEAVTFYRQHADNMAGLSCEVDALKVRQAIKVKLCHFKSLSKIHDENLRDLYLKLSTLKDKLSDYEFEKEYVAKIKSLNIAYPLWWEIIKLPEEFHENTINQ